MVLDVMDWRLVVLVLNATLEEHHDVLPVSNGTPHLRMCPVLVVGEVRPLGQLGQAPHQRGRVLHPEIKIVG